MLAVRPSIDLLSQHIRTVGLQGIDNTGLVRPTWEHASPPRLHKKYAGDAVISSHGFGDFSLRRAVAVIYRWSRLANSVPRVPRIITVTTSLDAPATAPPDPAHRAPRRRSDCRKNHRYGSTVRLMCLGANRTLTLGEVHVIT